MAIICASSMLPCGRYYYEPEGGYVGNPWVKFSFQYIYLYMAWILHHLDLIDHFIFQFFQNFYQKCLKLYKCKHFRWNVWKNWKIKWSITSKWCIIQAKYKNIYCQENLTHECPT
jgi:hypothetical protein